jgi:hypothetical protein
MDSGKIAVPPGGGGFNRNFDVLIIFEGARKNVMVTSIPMLPFFLEDKHSHLFLVSFQISLI